jgi:hypothetical protein
VIEVWLLSSPQIPELPGPEHVVVWGFGKINALVRLDRYLGVSASAFPYSGLVISGDRNQGMQTEYHSG